jgi:alkanesulfonate monooxygenase SsuD/methylene tetrahydromethanopterin reductase-like flavin-dependent oxidoreductase (luciferase family)
LPTARGREPRDILVFLLATVVVGRTEAEARDKLEDYRRHASVEGALAHYSASIGVDFAGYGLDEPIRYVKTDANNSFMEAITTRSPDTVWTKRRVMDQMILGSRQPPIVGTPAQIADAFEALMAETDIDGFNLSRTVMPECVEDFVALVIPELQNRGLYKAEYAPRTLREKLYGPGRARLTASHPAATARTIRTI